MINRETRRQARRPLSGGLQVETMTRAYQEVSRRADDLPTTTAQERNFAEGYAQALKDFARETGERQEALRRKQLQDGTKRLTHKILPTEIDEGQVVCAGCDRPLALVQIRKNLVSGFSVSGPDVRERVESFWTHVA